MVRSAAAPPPQPVEAAAAEPVSTPDVQPADAGGETLVGWLRRVFVGTKKETNAASPQQGQSVRPESAQPEVTLPAMVVLPDEEIANRLIEVVQIGETQLRGLAHARALAVRDHLIAAGIGPARLIVEDPVAGTTRVMLDLR